MTKYHKFFLGVGALIGLYFVLTVLMPPNPVTMQRYGISATTVRVINTSFAVIYGLIWMVAATGYVRLSEYAYLIKNNKDGKGFAAIAAGLGFLAIRMPLSSIANAFFLYFGRQIEWLAPVGVIVTNYLGVILALIGIGLISKGVANLLELVPIKIPKKYSYIMLGVLLMLISAYTYLAIGHPGFDAPIRSGQRATYYLPSWLIVSTIILPYAYAWYHGFMAVISLRHYRQHVKGALYKQGLRWLSWGIGIVMITSILLQFGGARLITTSRFQMQPLLITSYLWFLLIAIGFICIAMGARRLKKIEEV